MTIGAIIFATVCIVSLIFMIYMFVTAPIVDADENPIKDDTGEELIVRLAKSAILTRSEPGEDISGLTDEEFINKLYPGT